MSSKYKRREVLKNIALGSGVLSLGGIMSSFYVINLLDKKDVVQLKNKVNHSVCRWPYQDIPLEEFAKECAKMGLFGNGSVKTFGMGNRGKIRFGMFHGN